ncbi:MAG TPA: hypothetical protein VHN16_04900 [Streptosporangiaceae bacterium]|nr:hypothetical protein [Streptosporangiaceae bacterium]
MTEPEDVLLDRAQLERAFTALGERMVRRGVVADVFVVGGAAMALAYDATRVTRDVDSLFVPHGVVLEEARKVAQDLGLPAWWLNEQASVYISGKDDPGGCVNLIWHRSASDNYTGCLSGCCPGNGLDGRASSYARRVIPGTGSKSRSGVLENPVLV